MPPLGRAHSYVPARQCTAPSPYRGSAARRRLPRRAHAVAQKRAAGASRGREHAAPLSVAAAAVGNGRGGCGHCVGDDGSRPRPPVAGGRGWVAHPAHHRRRPRAPVRAHCGGESRAPGPRLPLRRPWRGGDGWRRGVGAGPVHHDVDERDAAWLRPRAALPARYGHARLRGAPSPLLPPCNSRLRSHPHSNSCWSWAGRRWRGGARA